jgi:hypothetical protein
VVVSPDVRDRIEGHAAALGQSMRQCLDGILRKYFKMKEKP